MPILFELIVLSLVAYGAGLALGWAMWGRAPRDELSTDDDQSRHGDHDE